MGKKFAFLLLFFSVVMGEAAFANKKATSTFTFQIPMFGFTSEKSGESSSKLSATSPDGTYGWITYKDWNVYLEPFSDGAPIGLGNMITESIELGAMIYLDNEEVQNFSSNISSFQPFMGYYHTFADNLWAEIVAGLEHTAQKTSELGSDGILESSTSKTTAVPLSLNLVRGFNSKFYGVASFYQYIGNTKGGGGTEDVKSSATSLVFSVRYTLK